MIEVNVKKKIVEFCNRPFLRNVIKLISGNAVAQLIALLCAPVVTRLYTPEDFGTLGFIAGISGFLALLATLRLDLALMLPGKDSSAWQLLCLAGRTSFVVVAFVFFLLLLFGDRVISLYGSKTYEQMLIWLPAFVLGSSWLNLAFSWAMRCKAFGEISRAVVTGSAISNSCKIGAGIAGFGGWFIIFATLLQQIVQTVFLSFRLRRTVPQKGEENSDYLYLVKRYRSFPLWRAPQDVIASMAANSPNVLFALYYSVQTVGFYLLAYRVTLLPVGFVKEAFQKVFYQKAIELHRKGRSLYEVVLKMTFGLIFFCVPFALLLFFYGESLFVLVFGREWLLAGTYSKYLGILVTGAVANSPCVVAVTILEKNRELFIYELFRTCLRLGVILVCGNYFNAEFTVAAFCAVSAISSACLISWVLAYLKKKSDV